MEFNPLAAKPPTDEAAALAAAFRDTVQRLIRVEKRLNDVADVATIAYFGGVVLGEFISLATRQRHEAAEAWGRALFRSLLAIEQADDAEPDAYEGNWGDEVMRARKARFLESKEATSS